MSKKIIGGLIAVILIIAIVWGVREILPTDKDDAVLVPTSIIIPSASSTNTTGSTTTTNTGMTPVSTGTITHNDTQDSYIIPYSNGWTQWFTILTPTGKKEASLPGADAPTATTRKPGHTVLGGDYMGATFNDEGILYMVVRGENPDGSQESTVSIYSISLDGTFTQIKSGISTNIGSNIFIDNTTKTILYRGTPTSDGPEGIGPLMAYDIISGATTKATPSQTSAYDTHMKRVIYIDTSMNCTSNCKVSINGTTYIQPTDASIVGVTPGGDIVVIDTTDKPSVRPLRSLTVAK